MRRSLKIGLVSFAWGDEHRGGLETHVHGIAHDLRAIGHQVFVHCVNTTGSGERFATRGWMDNGIQIQEMNYCYEDTKCLMDFQRVPQAEVILEHWVNHHQLDLLDFHHNLFFGIRAIATLSKSLPCVATLHDYWTLDPRGQLFSNQNTIIDPTDHESWEQNALQTWPYQTAKSLESSEYYQSHHDHSNSKSSRPLSLKTAWTQYSDHCLKHAAAVISPSRQAAHIHQLHGITSPIQTIENGLNLVFSRESLSREKQSSAPSTDTHNKIRIAILGTIAPHKGQLLFCQACLESDLHNIVAIQLHGPCPTSYHGNQSSQLAIKRISQDHPDVVTLQGPYDRADLPFIFSQTDLVAMPSLWHEVYGFVAREALAYGLPIITTNAGGLSALEGQEGVYTLPMTEPNRWSDILSLGFSEGPLYRWVYRRRQHLPVASDHLRDARACASDLSRVYHSVIQTSSHQSTETAIPNGRPST
jgi:glycosyltransferase involved in cell wall biosynthesis